MNKIKFISLTASLVLAMVFTLSCSLGDIKDYVNDSSSSSGGEVGNLFSYCLINGQCLSGPFTSKECGDLGGLPSNSNSCTGGGGNTSSSSGGGSNPGGGSSSSNSGGGGTTYSLDGVWQRADGSGMIVNINGSTGVWIQIDFSDVWQNAVSQGLVKIGDQAFRNLTKTGDLTWTGQRFMIFYNSSNVATSTSFENSTITMSADGQTFICISGGLNQTWTRYSGGDPSSSSNGGQGGGGYTGPYGSIEYGGQTYKTVRIGTQTWFAENLNYDPGTGYSACYDNQESKCAAYGRLYNWETALEVCPSGWHLSSDDEWTVLTDYVGGSSTAGTKLKETSGWNNNGNGTNSYGFSALPGGYASNSFATFAVGDVGLWWSANESSASYAYSWEMRDNNSGVDRGNGRRKGYFASVRCVQD